MFHHYPDMNFDGKKDWFDGFLFHEMIREIEEKDESEKEEDLFDDDLLDAYAAQRDHLDRPN